MHLNNTWHYIEQTQYVEIEIHWAQENCIKYEIVIISKWIFSDIWKNTRGNLVHR